MLQRQHHLTGRCPGDSTISCHPQGARSWGFHAVKQYSQHRPLIEGQRAFPILSLTSRRKINPHTVFLITVCTSQVKEGEKNTFMLRAFPRFVQVLYQASYYPAAELTPAACRCSEGLIHLPALLWVWMCYLCQYQIDSGLLLPSCWLPSPSEESNFTDFPISDFPFEHKIIIIKKPKQTLRGKRV